MNGEILLITFIMKAKTYSLLFPGAEIVRKMFTPGSC